MHPGVYIVLGFFVVLVILGVVWGRKMENSKRDIYIDFLHQYNLESHTGDLGTEGVHITGTINGFEFEITEKIIPSSGKKPTLWTYFTFKNSPFEFDFQIVYDNWLMAAAKGLGYTDHETGNEQFDKKYICHSKEAAPIHRIVDTFIQAELINVYDDFYGMLENKATEKTFEYVHQGRINYPYQMQSADKVLQVMLQILDKA